MYVFVVHEEDTPGRICKKGPGAVTMPLSRLTEESGQYVHCVLVGCVPVSTVVGCRKSGVSG